MHYLAIAIRCLIGVVFLLSFVGKVGGRGKFTAFTASIRDLRFLPAVRTPAVARLVVVAEGSVPVLLAVPSPIAVAAGHVLALALLLAFAAVIVFTVRRGLRVTCRCFGASPIPLGAEHVARNVVLAVLAAAGAVAAGVLPAGEAAHPAGALIAAVGGLTLGALVAVLDEILGLFRPMSRVGPSGSRLR
ncbi:MauE/DoxX family redox-associated membrane protein [Microtetraspora niveoalba]|uniref:MauE/DoxX family redox-associated membrane protein n=1 Tax=Microtetraspora niveoalba TaxID=46175 RepID=UPI00082BCC47|nr:MauE/DoxX family redox-associated membrane protein [Microtetraspora niveoalba]